MKNNHVTFKIVLFKSKTLKDGTHPVLLRVTKNRKHKHISLGYKCTAKQWDAKRNVFKKNMPNHVKKNRMLSKYDSMAHDTLDALNEKGVDFTLNQFAKAFGGDEEKMTLYKFYQQEIEYQKGIGSIKNAAVYKQTCKRFFDFCSNQDLTFGEFDVELVEGFIMFLKEAGNTSGISVRLRNLKALYNKAVIKGLADAGKSPFIYIKPSKWNQPKNPRPLELNDLRKIEKFDAGKFPKLINPRNFFMFSYYTWGMNFVDMANLRWGENIKNGYIVYLRSKTKSKSNAKEIVIKIDEYIQEILDYYKEHKTDTDYIFPIFLREGMTPQQKYNRIEKTRKMHNNGLKLIAKKLKFSEEKVTSMQGRHSMANVLKERGVSVAEISDIMGHGSDSITQAYLDSFGSSKLNEAAQKLRPEFDDTKE